MAETQSNARLRAPDGAPSSGVIHVRTRLTSDFTVISNALLQRGGSAVTIGVAAYILSLPDGSPVSIRALCAHFTEGEILISRALRELETAGYLERRRERTAMGNVRTRTFFHTDPGADAEPPGPEPKPTHHPEPPRPRRVRAQHSTPVPAQTPAPATAPEPAPVPTQAPHPEPAPPALPTPDPEAIAVLASLRRTDPRLILSAPEAARLAPAVTQWLAAGVQAARIAELLTTRLPATFVARPAAILAFRLRETPLPAPPADHPTTTVPLQNCDNCDRAFRSPTPGPCRDCRRDQPHHAAAAA
ncbi:hypothetical protein DSC45_24445 [Streptomyces sp. YIM 130001]|uniref:hypothetical protein n=1 Tax=Streptomyces sp. YIM 130001 TaxID=2259644 RepID=UPI000E65E649|nr:hypothetical protein [Streptomyces sp. YIM 130001]RII13139.1 hypothetical protein DSC45_24445 [Streptomyces sp. YIM 130001]